MVYRIEAKRKCGGRGGKKERKIGENEGSMGLITEWKKGMERGQRTELSRGFGSRALSACLTIHTDHPGDVFFCLLSSRRIG